MRDGPLELGQQLRLLSRIVRRSYASDEPARILVLIDRLVDQRISVNDLRVDDRVHDLLLGVGVPLELIADLACDGRILRRPELRKEAFDLPVVVLDQVDDVRHAHSSSSSRFGRPALTRSAGASNAALGAFGRPFRPRGTGVAVLRRIAGYAGASTPPDALPAPKSVQSWSARTGLG